MLDEWDYLEGMKDLSEEYENEPTRATYKSSNTCDQCKRNLFYNFNFVYLPCLWCGNINKDLETFTLKCKPISKYTNASVTVPKAEPELKNVVEIYKSPFKFKNKKYDIGFDDAIGEMSGSLVKKTGLPLVVTVIIGDKEHKAFRQDDGRYKVPETQIEMMVMETKQGRKFKDVE
jgi:hypothetical protein